MTQNQKQPKNKPSSDAPKEPEKKTPRSVAMNKTLSLIAIVISLVALVLTGSMMLQEKDRKQDLAAQQTSQINKLNAALTSLTKKLKTLEQTVAQAAPKDNATWRAFAAKQILDTASYQLYFFKHVKPTLALLKQADKLLAPVTTSEAIALRKNIEGDIAALRALPGIEQAALLDQLQQIQQRARLLSLKKKPLNEAKKPETNTGDTLLDKAKVEGKKLLGTLIIVRKHDEPIEPIVQSQQQYVLQESLFLLLQQAKWAVTAENQALFSDSLAEAAALLRRHASTNTDAKKIVAELDNMKDKPIVVSIPALKALAHP